MAFTPRIGDTVGYYSRTYVRGTRSPSNPHGRFRYSFRGNATLLAKNDLRGWRDGILASHLGRTPTQHEVDSHLGSHLGLANATGTAQTGDVTEGNNPLLLPSGQVVWAYADQIRKPR
jgi:hypothetical protein